MYIYIHIYIHQTSSSNLFVSEHLGCFQVLAMVNSAAMNNNMHTAFQIRAFSGYINRSAIAG